MSALSAWMKDVELMRLHQHNALECMRSLIPKPVIKVVKSIETIIPSTENLTIDTEALVEKMTATEIPGKKDEVVVEPLAKQAAKGKRKATTPTKPPAAKKTAVASKKVAPTTKPTVIDTPKVEVIVLDEAEVETVEAEPVLEVAKEDAAKVVEVIEIEDSPKPTKGKRKGTTTTDTTEPKAPAKKAKATPKPAALPKRTSKKA